MIAAAVAAADEPRRSSFPLGRVYTTVDWQPPGKARVNGIVAIDPQTGDCQTIAERGSQARLSPDARTLAYRTSFGTHTDVLVLRWGEGEEPTRIWTGDGTADVCWTNDGQYVIVSQAIRANNSWKFTTWLVEPQSGETSQIELPDTEGITDCAHHRELLISWSFRNKKRIELFTMLRDGSQATNLTGKRQYDYQGRFSPDDGRIALLRRQRGKLSVCTVDADGGNVQIAFTETELVSPDHVAWSPDGKHLATVLSDWTLDANGKKVFRPEEANYRIAIMNLDGSQVRELKLEGDVSFMRGIDWR